MENKKPLYEKIAEELLDQMRSGTSPIQMLWKKESGRYFTCPYNPTQNSDFTGVNSVWLALQQRSDPRWMTRQQAEDQGWQVKAGEKGTVINYLRTHEGRLQKKDNHQIHTASNRDSLMDRNRKGKPMLVIAVVFNAEQLTGVPQLAKKQGLYTDPVQWSDFGLAESIMDSSGIKIHHGGNESYYERERDCIHMPYKDQFNSAADYYATVFHEMAHWTGNHNRLDRPPIGIHDNREIAREELRAEIASLIIGGRLGIGNDFLRQADYVAHYMNLLRYDAFELHLAVRDAQRICNYLFSFGPKRVIGRNHREEKKLDSLQVNDLIRYRDSSFLILDKAGQGRFQVKNIDTGNRFKLSVNDGLYRSLLLAKLSPSVLEDMPLKQETETINRSVKR